jgi:hypothetical protein
MERLGVSVSFTPGFYHECNGQVERVNQDVGRFLRSYCQDRPGEFIPWAEMAQNSLRHSSTNLAPFQCVLGYQPVLAPWHQSQIEAPVVYDWFRRSEETWDAALVHLQRAVRRQKASADRHRSEAPVLEPGLALNPKPAPSPALPEAGSAVCGAIQGPEESKQGLLQFTASPRLRY